MDRTLLPGRPSAAVYDRTGSWAAYAAGINASANTTASEIPVTTVYRVYTGADVLEKNVFAGSLPA